MNKKPLLSIVTVNKNDNYSINILQQTKFILDYFLYSLKISNSLYEVEYLIVDWGSDKPFSNYFFNQVVSYPCIKFINVPKHETLKCKLSFDTSKAENIGIKNSLGKYIMLTSPDQFLPISILNNLLSLLKQPKLFGITGNEYMLVPRKYIIDDFFIYDESMERVDLYLQKFSHSTLLSNDFYMNDGSGAGGLILKKKHWLQIGGIKDSDHHNRGQDHVIFHEISSIFKHIDIATFGSFLLKLPRSNTGLRKKKMTKVKNPLNFLNFENNVDIIDHSNIEVISNFNPPKEKLTLSLEPSLESEKDFTIIEIFKAIIDCSVFTIFTSTSLRSSDVSFILKLSILVKLNKIKNIIFDENQSKRFILYLSKRFPGMTFFVFMDSKNINPIELLKYRNEIARRTKINGHYGYIKVTDFSYYNNYLLKNLQDFCIIQDFTSDNHNSSHFKKDIWNDKINAYRFLKKNKIVNYSIKGKFKGNPNIKNKLMLKFLMDIIIYLVKIFFKIKRILGNIKRQVYK